MMIIVNNTMNIVNYNTDNIFESTRVNTAIVCFGQSPPGRRGGEADELAATIRPSALLLLVILII